MVESSAVNKKPPKKTQPWRLTAAALSVPAWTIVCRRVAVEAVPVHDVMDALVAARPPITLKVTEFMNPPPVRVMSIVCTVMPVPTKLFDPMLSPPHVMVLAPLTDEDHCRSTEALGASMLPSTKEWRAFVTNLSTGALGGR